MNMGDSWKERAIKRKDFRHTQVEDIRPPSGSRKDTKKWCRGKIGRKHKPKCINYGELKNTPPILRKIRWKVLVCSACGKELDFWFGYSIFKKDDKKPDWVKP